MSERVTAARVARNVSAGVVAGIAAAASYTHMRTLAATHGQPDVIAALVPVSVDGLMVVATIAMHDDKHAGRPVRRSAWAAFVVGVVASVTANVLAAPDAVTARVISAWPAVALLLVVELLTRSGPRSGPARETPRFQAGEASSRDEAPKPHDTNPAAATERQDRDPGPLPEPAPADQPDRRDREEDQTPDRTATVTQTTRTATEGGPDVSDLIEPGRAVRDRLAAAGQHLTRRALIEGLRTDGHSVSTARASALLHRLSAEPHPAPEASGSSEHSTSEHGGEAVRERHTDAA